MKSRLFAIAITLAVTTIYSDVGIGVKGGLSLFKSVDNRSLGAYNEIRSAPEFTAFCEIEKSKILYHLISLTYYQAGGKTTSQFFDILGRPISNKFWSAQRLDYIGIGYGLEFKINVLPVVPYVAAGISLDILTKNKEEFSSEDFNFETHALVDSNFTNFNLRPHLTAGLEYKISHFAILADYTFAYNIIPYYMEKNGGIRYSTFGQYISAGLKFYL